MKLLLLVALAFPLGCLALLTFLALLGVLTLRGALRGVAQSGRAWAKLGAANSLDWLAVFSDARTADALAEKLDDIERIDRLTTIAANRRNACLREIDRRRAVLGETLRRSVQEVEDAEFEVIKTTRTKGKNAA